MQAPPSGVATSENAALWRWLRRLAWLGAIALLVWGAFSCDTAVRAWTLEHETKAWKRVAGEISDWGDFGPLAVVCAVLLAAAAVRNSRRWVQIFMLMLLAGILAGLTANVIRAATGRARPNSKIEPGWYGIRHGDKWLVTKSKYHAFPSAHSATIMGFVGPLLILAPRHGCWALLLVVLIGGSRIYLGAHHLSDVTVAILLGWQISSVTTHRLSRRARDWARSITQRTQLLLKREQPVTQMAELADEPARPVAVSEERA